MGEQKQAILFMSANPWQTGNFDPGEEEAIIREVIATDNKAHKLEVLSYPSINRKRLKQAFLTITSPWVPHILHLSIHGNWDGSLAIGIPLEVAAYIKGGNRSYDLLEKEKFLGLMGLMLGENQKLKCMILNACHSRYQAELFLQKSEYVISWNEVVHTNHAKIFSEAFYTNYTRSQNINEAFARALKVLELEDIKESSLPVLLGEEGKAVPMKEEDSNKSKNLEPVIRSFPDLRSELKFLITDGQSKKAIQILLDLAKNSQISQLENTLYLLSARLNQSEKEQMRGTIDKSSFSIENNKINVSLLELVDKYAG